MCTLAFCAPSTVLAAMLSAFAVFLFLFSLLAKTPVVIQRGLCALIIAALLAWLVRARVEINQCVGCMLDGVEVDAKNAP